jgi:hypothetical protein
LYEKCVQKSWAINGSILGSIAEEFPSGTNMRRIDDKTYGRAAGVDLWEYV